VRRRRSVVSYTNHGFICYTYTACAPFLNSLAVCRHALSVFPSPISPTHNSHAGRRYLCVCLLGITPASTHDFPHTAVTTHANAQLATAAADAPWAPRVPPSPYEATHTRHKWQKLQPLRCPQLCVETLASRRCVAPHTGLAQPAHPASTWRKPRTSGGMRTAMADARSGSLPPVGGGCGSLMNGGTPRSVPPRASLARPNPGCRLLPRCRSTRRPRARCCLGGGTSRIRGSLGIMKISPVYSELPPCGPARRAISPLVDRKAGASWCLPEHWAPRPRSVPTRALMPQKRWAPWLALGVATPSVHLYTQLCSTGSQSQPVAVQLAKDSGGRHRNQRTAV
jgi:hypothetical protein